MYIQILSSDFVRLNIIFFPKLSTALASVDVAKLCKDTSMAQYETDITFDPSIKMDLMDLPDKLPRLLVEVGVVTSR